MPTDRQLAANRANATHSTGPRTPDGKAAARRNRLTHGIHSDAPVVPGECPDDWDAHRAGVRASLAPVGTLEAELADRAATLLWRMRRVVRYETGAATAAVDHAVGTLTGAFDPADPVAGTFGRGNPAPPSKSVAGLRDELGKQRAKLDQLGAIAALVAELADLPDDHRLPDRQGGRFLKTVSQGELATDLDYFVFLWDLDLPDAAWDDPVGWDGWTAGHVRAVLTALGEETEQSLANLLAQAGRELERETAALRGKVARLEAGLARAEADLAGAVELARQVNLVPSQSTDKVIRYEAHLSRQLTQTFQLLDRLQAARAGGRFRPPVAAMTPTEEWESECVPPVGKEIVSAERTQFAAADPPEVAAEPVPLARRGVDSAERTQSAPEIPPAVVVDPVSSAGRAVVSAERTQTGPEVSPAAAAVPVPPAVWGVVSAERTQFEAQSPLVIASGSFTGCPDGTVERVR